MFGRKAKDYETTIAHLRQEAQKLESEKKELMDSLTKINTYVEQYPVPDDCKRGPWCRSCEFAKEFTYSKGWYIPGPSERIVVCGRSEVCKGYIMKKEND